jgi:hypothetical protein
MILKTKMTNKREQPDIKLHENNRALKRRVYENRYTPAVVRAMHTFSHLRN